MSIKAKIGSSDQAYASNEFIIENRNKKILIVDDQEFNIEALICILGIWCKIDTDRYCVRAESGE